ncbi:MAG: metallophosphoesterase family protein [Candidatus Hodarchaeota archaeon]
MSYSLAVISDIHANIVALEAVLSDIRRNFPEITEYLCPGDLVGYGPNPSEVIDRLISETKFTAVTKGNHDHAIGGGGRDIANFNRYIDKFNRHAQEAIKWQAQILSPEEKTFLYQLPSSRTVSQKNKQISISIIHGSPQYPLDEYIRPNTPAQKDLFPFMELFEIGILLLGHTHIPFVDKSKSSETGLDLLMCNPGSVGQPRDKDPRASYAVLDLENFSAEIIRVDYDIDEVAKKISTVGLPEFLSERLHKGT